MTAMHTVWKSDNPVSTTIECFKDLGRFVVIKSIQAGTEGSFKHVLSLIIFLRLYISQKSETVVVVGSALKSHNNKKFPYLYDTHRGSVQFHLKSDSHLPKKFVLFACLKAL